MEKIEVKLEKDNNDFFREWIIKEWQHHNTVDPIYQLRIIKPEELKFKENEEYYKILYNNKMVGFIGIKNYEKEIYLYRFFIDEKYRNNGIGTIALNQIIELAKFQNKDLSLEVIGENIARDLYERLGFKTHYRKMILKINDDIYENQEKESIWLYQCLLSTIIGVFTAVVLKKIYKKIWEFPYKNLYGVQIQCWLDIDFIPYSKKED